MMKCLYDLNFKKEMSKIFKETKIESWNIENNKIENRINSIDNNKKNEHLLFFINQAEKNKISATPEEMISWLDTTKILYKLHKELNEKHSEIINDLRIIAEYCIPFSQNNRTDILLINNNQILIIEFSYSTYENRYESYSKKINQVIYYKELLKNICKSNIEISTYTFIIHPEERVIDYDYEIEQIKNKCKWAKNIKLYDDEKYYKNNKEINKENINKLANYIILFFSKGNENAYEQLKKYI